MRRAERRIDAMSKSSEWVTEAKQRYENNCAEEDKTYNQFIEDYKRAERDGGKREEERTDSRRLERGWNICDLSRKRILVIGENGIGDEELTASCIHDLVPCCEHVVWRCDPKLQRLFARSFPKVEFITEADGEPDDVRVIYSWELIGRFRASLNDFGWLTSGEFASYLQFPQALRDKLKQRYSGEAKKLVGLAWRSERDGETVSNKTCDLLDVPHWKGFFDALKDKVRFVSLQYGDTQTEIDFVRWKYGVEIYQDQRVNIYDDVDAAAAQIAAMDFVVTISTTLLHILPGRWVSDVAACPANKCRRLAACPGNGHERFMPRKLKLPSSNCFLNRNQTNQ